MLRRIANRLNRLPASIACFNYARNYSASDFKNPNEPVVGPGAPDGVIPTDFEQTSGLERLEYLANVQGINIFLDEPLKIDAYGTLEKPVLVETVVGSRTVGCTGFPKYSHTPNWMTLKGTEVKRCTECGQAFKLTKAVLPDNLNDPNTRTQIHTEGEL